MYSTPGCLAGLAAVDVVDHLDLAVELGVRHDRLPDPVDPPHAAVQEDGDRLAHAAPVLRRPARLPEPVDLARGRLQPLLVVGAPHDDRGAGAEGLGLHLELSRPVEEVRPHQPGRDVVVQQRLDQVRLVGQVDERHAGDAGHRVAGDVEVQRVAGVGRRERLASGRPCPACRRDGAVGVTTTTWRAPGPGSGLPSAAAASRAGRSSRSQWLTVASGPTSASLKLRAPPKGISSAVFFIAGALKKHAEDERHDDGDEGAGGGPAAAAERQSVRVSLVHQNLK